MWPLLGKNSIPFGFPWLIEKNRNQHLLFIMPQALFWTEFLPRPWHHGNFWTGWFFVVWDCPVPGIPFNSILGLYLPHANSTHLSSLHQLSQPKPSLDIVKCPLKGKTTPVKHPPLLQTLFHFIYSLQQRQWTFTLFFQSYIVS